MTFSSFVKELKIDRGIFSVKTTSGKFSASESYKEQLSLGGLPPDAPKDFKLAIKNIYYAPVEKELIEYNRLHDQVTDEKNNILSHIENPTDEDRKKAQIESTKKILKANHINDKTLVVYSPILTDKFNEQDEYTRVSATYNHDEKTIYIKTELIKKTNIYKNVIYQDNLIPAMDTSTLDKVKEIATAIRADAKENNEPKIENHIVEGHNYHYNTDEKVDIEALKQKYAFKRPKVKSISEIISGKTEETNVKEDIKPENPKHQKIKENLSELLGYIKGEWKDNVFHVNKKDSGYLVPIEKIELFHDEIAIKSSPFTNTEWWTKFTHNMECPRYMGKLMIQDAYTNFCINGKCELACGVDEGFTELSAARFRLLEEKDIIKDGFKRLQSFLDRAFNLVNEFNETMNVNIGVYLGTQKPYFYSKSSIDLDYFELQNYISAYLTLYPEINDIRGNVDIDEFTLNDDFDPVDDSGLVQEARNYGLQEMVRLATHDLLEDVITKKAGNIDGNFYLIDHGKMRYVLKSNKVEAIRDELYMGNVSFKKGLNEIKNFISVTLGGGRW